MPDPTPAAIAAASALPTERLVIHKNILNTVKVHVGQRVRIELAPDENGTLKIAFTGGLPFDDPAPLPGRRRSTGVDFRTSVRGTFPFACFLDEQPISTPGYAGQIEVGPE